MRTCRARSREGAVIGIDDRRRRHDVRLRERRIGETRPPGRVPRRVPVRPVGPCRAPTESVVGIAAGSPMLRDRFWAFAGNDVFQTWMLSSGWTAPTGRLTSFTRSLQPDGPPGPVDVLVGRLGPALDVVSGSEDLAVRVDELEVVIDRRRGPRVPRESEVVPVRADVHRDPVAEGAPVHVGVAVPVDERPVLVRGGVVARGEDRKHAGSVKRSDGRPRGSPAGPQ